MVRREWGPAGVTAAPADVVVVVDVLRFTTAVDAVVAACLRNAAAVAGWLADKGSVTVVPCGERWPDGSLRPALEDLLGAGAVIAALPGEPEAAAAEAVWRAAADDLPSVLAACASGREQVARGWAGDLAFASEVDASRCVPLLVDGVFVDADAERAPSS